MYFKEHVNQICAICILVCLKFVNIIYLFSVETDNKRVYFIT